MAEGEGFEPPLPVKVNMISSHAHSTGLCHPSVRREKRQQARKHTRESQSAIHYSSIRADRRRKTCATVAGFASGSAGFIPAKGWGELPPSSEESPKRDLGQSFGPNGPLHNDSGECATSTAALKSPNPLAADSRGPP